MRGRALLPLLCFVAVLVLNGCSGNDESSTQPSDPNAPLYGIYVGNLTVSWGDWSLSEDPMTLQLSEGSIAVWLNGVQYPCSIQAITPSRVLFSLPAGSCNFDCLGVRKKIMMTGTAKCSNASCGTFVLTKVE